MIFVGVRFSFGAGFSMGVENFYIEKSSTESASQEYIRLDVSRILLCRRSVYPPLRQCRE